VSDHSRDADDQKRDVEQSTNGKDVLGTVTRMAAYAAPVMVAMLTSQQSLAASPPPP